jgi:hypothetical protein
MKLLDRAAVRLDDSLHPPEVPRQQSPQSLRIPRLTSAVEPVTSQKSTVTVFRCSRAGAKASNGAAQYGRKRKSPSLSRPHSVQTGTTGQAKPFAYINTETRRTSDASKNREAVLG